jgi:hypothetical protein
MKTKKCKVCDKELKANVKKHEHKENKLYKKLEKENNKFERKIK